jgi:hypothetical protein
MREPFGRTDPRLNPADGVELGLSIAHAHGATIRPGRPIAGLSGSRSASHGRLAGFLSHDRDVMQRLATYA